ncbi:MAG TPA: DUF3300 domain-containing protein [Opitutaceae bacterium]|jgi:hypothetical protein
MPAPKQIAALAGAACLLCSGCVHSLPPAAYGPPAQPAAYAAQPPPAEAPAEGPPQAPGFSQAQLDALVGPVALYPDPLVAILLPAASDPSDIVAAAAYLEQYGDRTQIDYQPWDPSVRALAHYPSVIAWMAQNMDWAGALGSAFASSPSEVMEAVQRMRQRALTAGTLLSTAQQTIYSDDGYIEIYPTDPAYLYVPSYDPGVVYADQPYDEPGPFLSFGPPYPEGDWLSFYFDWGSRRVWHGGRAIWAPGTGWRPPAGGQAGAGAQAWRPRHWVPTRAPRPGALPSPRPIRPPPAAPSFRGAGRAAPRAAGPETRARPAVPAPGIVPQAPRALPPAPRSFQTSRPALPRAPRAEAPARQPPAPPPGRRPENER